MQINGSVIIRGMCHDATIRGRDPQCPKPPYNDNHASGVGAALDSDLPAAWGTAMTETKPKRRWFRFSLRTLFVLVTIVGHLCGLCGLPS